MKDNDTILHNISVVTALECKSCILFHNEDRNLVFLVDELDLTEDFLNDKRSQAQTWFIQEEKTRTTHQSSGDGKHLLLSTGEASGLLLLSLSKNREEIEHFLLLSLDESVILKHKGSHIKVLLNGKDMGAASELKGLKTGDKVEVTFKDQVTEPTKEQLDKAAKEAAGDLVLTARSAKLKNGSVKVVVKADLKAITDAGYTVKYKFYRSTKKSAGYKAMKTGKSGIYINTYGKKGTMYYYKARVMIYDKDGNFVAQTALKQCKYANRLWTK